MDDSKRANEVLRLAEAFEAGEITQDEFRRQMAKLRDKRLKEKAKIVEK